MKVNQPTPTHDDVNDWMSSAPKDVTQVLFGDNPTIWVFGYGSLLWKPNFQYKSKVVGYIDGYERRFYQGNETFRGVPGKPGRVANLVENKECKTWGVAYEISGREEVAAVLKNLYQRETASGGYTTLIETFYPRQESAAHKGKKAQEKESVQFCKNPDPMEWSHNLTDEDVARLFASRSTSPDLSRSESSMSMSSSDESSSDEEDQIATAPSSSVRSMEGEESIPRVNYNHVEDNSISSSTVVFQINDENVDVYSTVDAELVSEDKREEMSFRRDGQLAPVQALVYTATPDNDQYLGPDDVTIMARQIVTCAGTAGTNVEYVTKIAEYVRKYIPEDDDQHLFALEAKIIEEVLKIYRDSDRPFTSVSDFKVELFDLEQDVRATNVVRAS